FGGFTLKLMQIDPMGGEPVEVADLTEPLGGRLIRFGVQRFYLSGPSAISPDGRTLAVLATSAQEMALGQADGLWLLDLETPDAPPRQVAPVDAFQAGLPPWQDQPAVPRGLQWTADGQGLVVAALSNDLRLPLLLVSYVDAASGELTAINDYSDVATRADFFVLPGPGQKPRRYAIPWTAAVAPTANVALLLNDLGGVLTISQAALPGGEPRIALQRASPGHEVWTRASAAANGAILVYGLLLETEALSE
ncbi:MAG TPA: hypothetical protein VNK95_16180, partial [Caldilineaceae bacterium]|nr:hypothetical protein [Caldilineaceae bacterium]